ncbi:MAG TPA: tRNA pseudouridine(55) synthase TruB, partial [Chloroflexota bacterium]|nr:tRNA pseudouridine(55) synthase TruB [Chloroflexota bacterium]
MVSFARRIFHQRRVGHAGTLDPLAEGVLPLLLGRATRLADFLADGHKVYYAEVLLG